MEADWEFEIGPGAPVIDADWPGLVDLRHEPGRVGEIDEAKQVAGLAEVLVRLNDSSSPVWTAKCDVWAPEKIDPDEMEAPPVDAAFGLACYIDVLPRENGGWSDLAGAEAFCRKLVHALRIARARCCRTDLVVRQAVLRGGGETVGITVYLAGCGTDGKNAELRLTAALSTFTNSDAAGFSVQKAR